MKHGFMIDRRGGLKGLTALALTGAAAPLRATEPADAELLVALRDHLRYSAGFRNKLRTGYYAETSNPTAAQAGEAYAQLKERIGALAEPSLALIHYVDKDGRLLAWLVGSEGVLASHATPGAYAGLDYLTNALGVNRRMQTRVAVPRAPTVEREASPVSELGASAALERASAELLGPAISQRLAESRGRLLFLPIRDTGTAPLAALPLGSGEYLAQRFSIVVMPDVQTLADAQLIHQVAGIDWSKVLLVGNPDLSWNEEFVFPELPGAQAEVGAVGELLGVDPARMLFQGEATLDRVVRLCSGYGSSDLVYLASHAIANRTNPMDGSFIGLTGGNLTGQLLRSKTFESWGMRHPLVVLSACQTALGRVFDGGSFGITRAVFAAGAAQVVSSFWNVSDSATKELMVDFMDRLYLGYSTEAALQRAQAKMAAKYPADPGLWAGFGVYGMPSTRS